MAEQLFADRSEIGEFMNFLKIFEAYSCLSFLIIFDRPKSETHFTRSGFKPGLIESTSDLKLTRREPHSFLEIK